MYWCSADGCPVQGKWGDSSADSRFAAQLTKVRRAEHPGTRVEVELLRSGSQSLPAPHLFWKKYACSKSFSSPSYECLPASKQAQAGGTRWAGGQGGGKAVANRPHSVTILRCGRKHASPALPWLRPTGAEVWAPLDQQGRGGGPLWTNRGGGVGPSSGLRPEYQRSWRRGGPQHDE